MKELTHDINNQMMVIQGLSFKLNKAVKNKDMDIIESISKKINDSITATISLISETLSPQKKVTIQSIFDYHEEYAADNDLKITSSNDSLFNHEFKKIPITRVVQNILKNAIEEDSVSKLRIFYLNHAITIMDNGNGFPKEILNSFKLGNGLSTKTTGNGIGLLSMKKCLNNLGWDMIIGNKSGAVIRIIKKGHKSQLNSS